MKFGTLHQILNPVTVTWPNIEIFEIQEIWNSAHCGGRQVENRSLLIDRLSDFSEILYEEA